jgi:hypothetical protein
MTVATYSIKATCTKCGHSGDVFVSDSEIERRMREDIKERMGYIWVALMTPRMVVSWIILLTMGLAIGFIFGVRQ